MTSITTTIHIIDQPGGGVMVYTTAGSPLPGQRLTPGQALATDLLTQCTHRASDVRYWHSADKPLDFVQSVLDPERNGWAVSELVRDQARMVLGIPRVLTPRVPA